RETSEIAIGSAHRFYGADLSALPIRRVLVRKPVCAVLPLFRKDRACRIEEKPTRLDGNRILIDDLRLQSREPFDRFGVDRESGPWVSSKNPASAARCVYHNGIVRADLLGKSLCIPVVSHHSDILG